MKILLGLLLFSSCTVLPRYEAVPVNYCKQYYYDTICPGWEEEAPKYNGCSVYDNEESCRRD